MTTGRPYFDPTFDYLGFRSTQAAARQAYAMAGIGPRDIDFAEVHDCFTWTELSNIEDVEFKDLNQVDMVGLYPNYAAAYAAWKSKAQGTVDNAHMRYFIVHLHRLLDPDTDTIRPKD